MLKHLLFIAFVSITGNLFAQNADTLAYERFETGGTLFTLNSPDQSGVSAAVGYNQWLINNEYTGGSGSLVCSGFPTTFTVPDTPLQPAGTTGGTTTNYMHMNSDAGQAAGILNCSYLAANGLCGNDEYNFSRMSQDVNTTGYDSVNVSFIWLCAGGGSIYGEYYYSIDGGNNWILITAPTAQFANQTTWATRSVSIPAFAGQATLRIGFRFVNEVSFIANDPGFAIDEFLITASVNVPPPPPPVAAFSVSDSTICAGTCIDFTDLSTNNPTSWFWVFSGGTTSFSTQQNPQSICYLTPGTYDVTLIVGNATGTDTITVTTVTVYANPAAPFITVSNDTLFATPGFATYEWYLDSVLVPGSNSDTLVTSSNGYYSVTATDSNGCSAVSSTVLINTGITEISLSHVNFYPNPANDHVYFESGYSWESLIIYDITGKEILARSNELKLNSVDVSLLVDGCYLAKLTDHKQAVQFFKLVIAR